MLTTESVKQAARCIQALTPVNIEPFDYLEALGLISRTLGFSNWQELGKTIDAGTVGLPSKITAKEILACGETLHREISPQHRWIDLKVANAIALLVAGLHVQRKDLPENMWRMDIRGLDELLVFCSLADPDDMGFSWREKSEKPRKVAISEHPVLQESCLATAIRNLFFLNHVPRLTKLLSKPRRHSKRKGWDGRKFKHTFWSCLYEGNEYIVDASAQMVEIFIVYPYQFARVPYSDGSGELELNKHAVVYNHDDDAALAAGRFRQFLFYQLLNGMKAKTPSQRTDKEKTFFWTFGEEVDHTTVDVAGNVFSVRFQQNQYAPRYDNFREERYKREGKPFEKYDPDRPSRKPLFFEGEGVTVLRQAYVVSRDGMRRRFHAKPFKAEIVSTIWDRNYGWLYTGLINDQQVEIAALPLTVGREKLSPKHTLKHATIPPGEATQHYENGGRPLILLSEHNAEKILSKNIEIG